MDHYVTYINNKYRKFLSMFTNESHGKMFVFRLRPESRLYFFPGYLNNIKRKWRGENGRPIIIVIGW